jgi:uncharacterized repeat protein (TIGR03803 family)
LFRTTSTGGANGAGTVFRILMAGGHDTPIVGTAPSEMHSV